MSKHDDFILTSMSVVLKETIIASSGIGAGVETYPLCDYIMQSTFLKMTGYQEQKMKCVIWEIATNDFEFRRDFLSNKFQLGECSTYKAKNDIYKSLCKQIKDLNLFDNADIKKRVKEGSFQFVKSVFENTNLAIWDQCSFENFSKSDIIKENQYLNNKNNLVENIIQNKYELLYSQRNRIAHNTLSYQQNLPDLTVLKNQDEHARNYFLWFSILLLIDNIFIELYKIYQKELEERIW
ncbi:hypothetical protein [Campylobacter sp. RM9328]|uniref:hypothetical protein n=1 Tax=Campylobacter sp. RM9328 TaxID=1705720 RepID=UPI00147424EB|nr:hypothetical protein [Campylobacter sp. RM9328]